MKSEIVSPSDFEEEGPHIKNRLHRVEKEMFVERKLTHEPVVIEEIERYRSPSRRQFPKMYQINEKDDLINHCEKFESLMTVSVIVI